MFPKANLPIALSFLLLAGAKAKAGVSNSDYYFIDEAETVSTDWKYTPGFAFFTDSNFPWLFHHKLGFVFLPGQFVLHLVAYIGNLGLAVKGSFPLRFSLFQSGLDMVLPAWLLWLLLQF